MTSRLEGEKTGICVMYTGAASEIDDGRRRRHERRARAMIIIKKTQQNAFFETTHPLLFIPLCRSSKPREFVYTITQQSASDDDDRHRRVALASNVSLIKLGWKWKRRTLISSNHNLSLFHVIKKKKPESLDLTISWFNITISKARATSGPLVAKEEVAGLFCRVSTLVQS